MSAGRAPSLRVFTLAFALQLRKKHGKTSVRVRETSVRLIKSSVRIQYTYYKNTHTLQNRHKHTHYKTHKHTHTPHTHTHTHHTHTHTHTHVALCIMQPRHVHTFTCKRFQVSDRWSLVSDGFHIYIPKPVRYSQCLTGAAKCQTDSTYTTLHL
jgi:hypothetical protein